jgi:phosphatidylinositol-3-phosphatase
VDQRIDHYTLLRTIEEMYGLTPLGSAAGAKPITGIWTAGG